MALETESHDVAYTKIAACNTKDIERVMLHVIIDQTQPQKTIDVCKYKSKMHGRSHETSHRCKAT